MVSWCLLVERFKQWSSLETNTQFVYDANGRCVQIAENGSTPSFSGNAIKNFLWFGAERCEERDGSNAVVSVFSGLGQKTSGTNEFYSFDHLGSIREVTNGSGTVLGAFDFDPYGNMSVLSGSVKPDFGFTGIYQHSRTNLALTWFRQYNPGLGRWLSRDPLGESEGLNLYRYAGNNPISNVDPLGLIRNSVQQAVIQAVRTGDIQSLKLLAEASGPGAGLSINEAALLDSVIGILETGGAGASAAALNALNAYKALDQYDKSIGGYCTKQLGYLMNNSSLLSPDQLAKLENQIQAAGSKLNDVLTGGLKTSDSLFKPYLNKTLEQLYKLAKPGNDADKALKLFEEATRIQNKGNRP